MGKSKTTQDATGPQAFTAAFSALNPAVSTAWAQVFEESARFLTDRLQQDMETQKALLACKTPADLFKVQSEFYQAAVQQYSDEATRLFQMMSTATQEGLDASSLLKGRKYDDVPL